MGSTQIAMRRSVVTVAALAALFVACKSNSISSDNNSLLTQTIGPAGGTFTDTTNFEQITVPAGALSADVALQMGTLADGAYPSLPSGVTKQGPVYAIRPFTTSFSTPAVIALPVPSGQSGLVAYAVSSDTSGTWSTVSGSAGLNFNGRDYVQFSVSTLGVYTLAPGGCVPASSFSKCVNNPGGVTVMSQSGGCTATAGGADPTCGGCKFVMTCDTSGCTCAETTTGRMLPQTKALSAPTACADSTSGQMSMLNACAGFGG